MKTIFPKRPLTALAAALSCVLLPWSLTAQTLTKNPAAAGLWVGEVTLSQVKHAAGNTNAPTADKAQMRLLLHVATDGTVRLLKDVTAARKLVSGGTPLPPAPPGQPSTPTDPFAPAAVILVTDPALLPGLTGVIRRNGKLVGQRFATAAYDFPGNELVLTGGIGQNFACQGSLTLPDDFATNPFRHKYHPDHSRGLTITRAIGLRFTQAMGNSNGMDQLVGEYEETVTGVHRTALTTKGTVLLNRLSPVGVLNQ